MPDRIRESIFDILASRFRLPGTIPPFGVADLFAGSGSMGLEAVSRGAACCDFVERRGPALPALKANLKTLAAGPFCRIINRDAWTVALTTPRPDCAFGLIFVDPPYVDSRDTRTTGRLAGLMDDLYRAGWADRETVVVAHHEKRVTFPSWNDRPWTVTDRRVYGTACITFVAATPIQDPTDDPAPVCDANRHHDPT